MSQMDRILLITVILLADVLVFMLPLTALFAAYVIWQRPEWFREWILKLYESA